MYLAMVCLSGACKGPSQSLANACTVIRTQSDSQWKPHPPWSVYLNAFGVLLIKRADVKGICSVDFSPRRD